MSTPTVRPGSISKILGAGRRGQPPLTAPQPRGDGAAIIELRSVVKIYDGLAGAVTALNGIDLQVRAGEFFVVTGKSGSGKTTLVNMITGLDRSTSGEIWVDGASIHRFGPERAARFRARVLGVVFQTFELLPTLTVLQNVMLPMDFAHRYPQMEQRHRAMHLLEQVEIAEHARKLPAALSGGQQQRLSIARAMANDPPILIADEPTGSLDSATARAIIDIFAGLVQQGRTVFMVTHDKDIAARGSRIISLSDGRIVGASPLPFGERAMG
jgi:putative ABC transport system ATP-binding protein